MRFALVVAVLIAPSWAEEPPSALLAREKSVRERVERELRDLVRYCASAKAYSYAQRELARGLAIAPESVMLIAEREKIEGKADDPKRGFGKKFEKKRAAVDLNCAKLLAGAALLYEQRGFPDRYDALLAITREHFASKAAFKAFKQVYFEPYGRWYRKAAHARLKAGGEFHDGKWLKRSEVQALDRQHSGWADPWVLQDDVHELRTTLPLRDANRLLHHVGAFRRFVLSRFDGAWDLRPPKGKLPVIFTATRDEMMTQMQKYTRGAGQPQGGAAFYLQTNSELNPCFVALELPAGTGKVRIPLEHALLALRHELTHQIAFEYSKHDYDRSRLIEHDMWCVEGLANYLEFYEVREGVWQLSRPARVSMGKELAESAFAWCRQNRRSIPPIAQFIKTPARTFATAENYHISAVLAWFLLDGSDRRYRSRFVRLLEQVHRVRDRADLFDRCFEGVDPAALQSEWEEFLGAIRFN